MFAGKCLLSCCLHLALHIRKDLQSLVDRLVKLLLFLCEHLENKVLLLLNLRISILALINNYLCNLCKECTLNTKHSAISSISGSSAVASSI